jgi:hypothetical protein
MSESKKAEQLSQSDVRDNEFKLQSDSDKKFKETETVIFKTGALVSNEDDVERGKWSTKIEFILTCLSFVVGFGNSIT